MNIWFISREYAGIAEAGGVKNVTCSLAESLAKLDHKITLFIPYYGCSDLSKIENCNPNQKLFAKIKLNEKDESINYFLGTINSISIVLIEHHSFTEKKAVYTYTKEDELENPEHKQGEGHLDVNFLNTIFQKAVIKYGELFSQNKIPDIIHCQDAPTAMTPVYAHFSNIFEKTKFVVTIHNAGPGYHHNFENMEKAIYYTGLPKNYLEQGFCNNTIEPFLLAGLNSCITTVSPQYAKEILENKTDTAGLAKSYNDKNISIIGITNGIDFSRYDPTDITKSLLPFSYNPGILDLNGKYKNRKFFLENFATKNNKRNTNELTQFGYIDTNNNDDDFIYIAYHGRVVHQKGIEVMCQAAENILEKKLNAKFIFVGQGSPELEKKLSYLANAFEGNAVFLKGYEKISARLSVAVADFSLHPSWFEPCGLEDFIAQTFGTIPIAHATGGLNKIINEQTGYLYSNNTAEELSSFLEKLILQIKNNGRKSFEPLIQNAFNYIHENFSWDKVAIKYENLYESL